jgi:sugar lactone lactonase YvrE
MACPVEIAARTRDSLGECPIWDEREAALWWVNIHAPAVKRLDPVTGKVAEIAMPEPVGSIALRRQGGLLAALQSGFYLLEPGGALELFARPGGHGADHRLNDGRCDRAGRFWAGSMNEATKAPSGSLYRLSPDGTCRRMRGGIAIPNSLAWSPDGRTMYFADSPRDTIWAYDYCLEEGEASNERVFARTEGGHPDGSCVDAEGCLWNAQYGAGQVVRYTPEGKIDRIVALPVANPTCCAFGGAQLETLYITSASQRLTPEALAKQPLAGSVLTVRPGVRGIPESRFG